MSNTKAAARLTVTSSPHITDNASVREIMTDVIIALVPATVVGAYFFGLYALLIVALTIASCYAAEFVYNKMLKKMSTTGDLSAVVTGLILGLNLPPNVPLYIPVIGGIFAIIVVKMLFGGIGKNFANPAVTARVFLLLCFTLPMTKFISPYVYHGNSFWDVFLKSGTDAVTGATPLAGGNASFLSLFIGNIGGSIGEVSKAALLIGGVYLCIKRVIDYRLPLMIIAAVAAFTFIFTGDIAEVLPAVFSGGLLFGAIFMATDYSTSPNTFKGTIIFALIIGVLTAVIREYSFMPEGVSYAILLGNIAVPLIDKYIYPRPLWSGHNKEKIHHE